MPESKTIHGLYEGQALCGFSSKLPAEWPTGHLWARVEDIEHITCDNCKAIAKRRFESQK